MATTRKRLKGVKLDTFAAKFETFGMHRCTYNALCPATAHMFVLSKFYFLFKASLNALSNVGNQCPFRINGLEMYQYCRT